MLEMLNGLRITGAIPALPVDHEARIRAAYEAMIFDVVAGSGDGVLSGGKSHVLGFERKDFADFFQRLAQEFIGLEAVRQRITAVAKTTRDQLVRMVSRGQEQGESLDVIARDIEKRIPLLSRLRANRIARTEIHGAANYGAHNAAKATGLTLLKEWVSVVDTRIRDFNEPTIAEFDHRRMDGVTVAMEHAFNVPRRGGGTEGLMFPGDTRGSAANIINCRCQSVHIVPD
jgi:uncharacterized protein with gpF-like domain